MGHAHDAYSQYLVQCTPECHEVVQVQVRWYQWYAYCQPVPVSFILLQLIPHAREDLDAQRRELEQRGAPELLLSA